MYTCGMDLCNSQRYDPLDGGEFPAHSSFPAVPITDDWQSFVATARDPNFQMAVFMVEHTPQLAAAYQKLAAAHPKRITGEEAFTSHTGGNNTQFLRAIERLTTKFPELNTEEVTLIVEDVLHRQRAVQKDVFGTLTGGLDIRVWANAHGFAWHYDGPPWQDPQNQETSVYVPYGDGEDGTMFEIGGIEWQPPVPSIVVFPGHRIKHAVPPNDGVRISSVMERVQRRRLGVPKSTKRG